MKSSYLASLLWAGLILSSPTWAVSYTFTELIPTSGAYRSQAHDINNVGQIVGVSNYHAPCMGCGGYTYATLWNGPNVTNLGTAGGTSGNAYAINDSGQVAGTKFTKYNSTTHAALWDGTSATDLYPWTMGGYSYAYAINNVGQVAGNSNSFSNSTSYATVWNGLTGATFLGPNTRARAINDAGQVAGNIDSQAVVWNGTTPTYLDSLGGGYSTAEAINNAGQVVGRSLTTGPNSAYHASLWNGTTATDLGSLSGNSYAFDINNSGQAVGSSSTIDGTSLAILWSGTTMIDLNSFLDASTVSAGWALQSASGINDQGWIIGTAVNSISQVTSAFLLTPSQVPLPAAAWLFGSGILGLIGVARRRKPTQPSARTSGGNSPGRPARAPMNITLT